MTPAGSISWPTGRIVRGALRKRYDTSEFRQVRVAPAIELIWAMLRRKSSCETGAGFPV